ncbi:ArnT family glycosyltransferase [Amycolatopsis sp. lyj-109]|uniref:ArnT family glycosyltransferase n=1 Tax=Amycolatopsis sp. lyj-109 TaxID=2789287 RepID=UPI00397D1F80
MSIRTTDIHATRDPDPPVRPQRRWQPWALAGICVGAAILYAWGIADGRMGNSYYSAAVKSMSSSLTNFLFGSFDAYGVFTVDKPPMSLWPQVVSTWVFGFHGWALLVPQVLEGVAAVVLLHRTVRRWAGENVALAAALILTVTPITVAINRDNNPDTLLVLLLVAAAYAFTRSVQATESRPRTRWLLWCAFFIGCGFVTKMLQAWIVVPGFAAAYLAGSGAPVRRRILDVLAAAAVLVASSFWWVALVDLWPGEKPYIGGSTDGSALDLIFGYNGFGRIFGGGEGMPGGGARPSGLELPAGMDLPTGGMGGMFGGDIGPGRMFGADVGGQISWLLPLALLVIAVASVGGIRRIATKTATDRAARGVWLMWGSWLVVTAVVFSYAQGIWHSYYTTMLAPAIAAIAAAGLAKFWRFYRAPDGSAWLLLPAAIAITGGWAFVLVSRDTGYLGWLRWVVLVATVLTVAGLAVARTAPAQFGRAQRPAVLIGLVAALVTPGAWSVATATTGSDNGNIPAAGPSGGFPGAGRMGGGMRQGQLPGLPSGTGGFPSNGQVPGMPTGGQVPQQPGGGRPADAGGPGAGMAGNMFGGAAGLSTEQRKVLAYAEQHGGGAAITLAVDGSAMMAAPYILGSDDTVIGMGGFSGTDDSPSVGQLQRWVADGTLRFVLSPSSGMGAGGPGGMFGGAGGAASARSQWIEQHCTKIDPAAYGGTDSSTLNECHA